MAIEWGLLFESDMLTFPIRILGLALLGVGTVLTAYGSGMLDDLGTDHPGYSKPENQLNFGISMGINFSGLGFSKGLARGILYKEIQEKLVTGFIPSIKSYGKTIIDETFWDNKNMLTGIAKEYFINIIENYIFDNLLRGRSY